MLKLKGIVMALQHFGKFTSHITVFSDHKPVVGMIKHGKASELYQYLSFLEETGITVKYKKGSNMVVSDTLSCMHIRKTRKALTSTERAVFVSTNKNKIIELVKQLHLKFCHLGIHKIKNLLEEYESEGKEIYSEYRKQANYCEACQRVNKHLKKYGSSRCETYNAMD